MNIFFLHLNCKQCAKYYFDKHCIKIILEIAQMLYTAHWITEHDENWIFKHKQELNLNPYKKTHHNHPISQWVRQHVHNYTYVCKLGIELCKQYTFRYKKEHKVLPRLKWLYSNKPSHYDTNEIKKFKATLNIPLGCTPVPLAMPERYYTDDLIYSYRLYYLFEKKHIAPKVQDWINLCIKWKCLINQK